MWIAARSKLPRESRLERTARSCYNLLTIYLAVDTPPGNASGQAGPPR